MLVEVLEALQSFSQHPHQPVFVHARGHSQLLGGRRHGVQAAPFRHELGHQPQLVLGPALHKRRMKSVIVFWRSESQYSYDKDERMRVSKSVLNLCIICLGLTGRCVHEMTF